MMICRTSYEDFEVRVAVIWALLLIGIPPRGRGRLVDDSDDRLLRQVTVDEQSQRAGRLHTDLRPGRGLHQLCYELGEVV